MTNAKAELGLSGAGWGMGGAMATQQAWLTLTMFLLGLSCGKHNPKMGPQIPTPKSLELSNRKPSLSQFWFYGRADLERHDDPVLLKAQSLFFFFFVF